MNRFLRTVNAPSAIETEELADVYFFRPLGTRVARMARGWRATPNQVTCLAGILGVAGGLFLWSDRLALLGFVVLIVHSIFDSADGQLARMTGQTSESGFFVDGAADYAVEVAICVGVCGNVLGHDGRLSIIWWAVLANLAMGLQAMLYVYHRAAYKSVVAQGIVAEDVVPHQTTRGPIGWLAQGSTLLQRHIVRGQIEVAQALRARADGAHVRENDRVRYAECFYWPKRAWNLFGANTRFYAIGFLAWLHRLDLYFAFILVPMNLALIAIWFWQERIDRRFLATLHSSA